VSAISAVSTAVIGVGEFSLLVIRVPVTMMAESDEAFVASAPVASGAAAALADDLGVAVD
jgi:hypothetical protein